MVVSLDTEYSKRLRRATSYLPVWFPGSHLAIGDAGYLVGNRFCRESTFPIADLLVRSADAAHLDIDYSSSKGVELATKQAGRISSEFPYTDVADAGIAFRFARRGAFVFRAHGCAISEVENLQLVKSRMHDWYLDRRIGLDYFVVTEVITARSLIAMMANGGGGRVELSLSVAESAAVSSARVAFQADLHVCLATSDAVALYGGIVVRSGFLRGATYTNTKALRNRSASSTDGVDGGADFAIEKIGGNR